MRNQPLRFSFEGKDYFIQFAYKQDQKVWDDSVAKNSKWTPKLLKAINEAVEAIVNSEKGLRSLPPVLFSDLEEAPKLTHSNVAICEILRGNVGDSTKEMVTWFKGKTYRAVMDNFNKETARNHALEHALKDANAFEGLAKENGIDLSAAERYVGGEQDKAFISLISRFRFAAWEAYNHRKDLHCAGCGKTGVRTVWKIEEVPYGDPIKVELNSYRHEFVKVYLPVRQCASCGLQWTDQEAEEIREAAVKELKKPSSPAEKHLAETIEGFKKGGGVIQTGNVVGGNMAGGDIHA